MVEFITASKVKWAIDSFKPFKSPGRDGIFPALLQNADLILAERLSSLFRACLILGYIPKLWQEVRVVFIPKAGRSDYSTAKSYRPISLTSFLLKSLERICEWELRVSVPRSGLSQHQHAYMKGRSVETALHEVVYLIEKSFVFRQSTLATFIDIEGAFNNVLPGKITESLLKLGVNPLITEWISHMLRNRVIFADLGGESRKGWVHKGTPQGGILSPLLWVFVMDNLLNLLTQNGFHVTCYADDLVIMVTGPFETELCGLMQHAIQLVINWAADFGLSINPQKTELCLFTKRRLTPQLTLPSINSTTLELKDKVKYLGVILDKKLSWKPHLEERARKACAALSVCRRAMGKRWGLKPRMINWLYTSVIRPILTYGAGVWWNAMDVKSNRSILEKVQRLGLLAITGAMNSTSTKALEVILNVLPIEIQVKKEAAATALRLHLNGSWTHSGTRVPHERILDLVRRITPATNKDSDRLLETILTSNFGHKFPSRAEWEAKLAIPPLTHLIFYTDGSKMDSNVGAGIFCEDLGVKKSLRLEDHATIFQAEVKAILETGKYLRDLDISELKVAICTDSQAAIKALIKPFVTSKLVMECKNTLNSVSSHNEVLIIWVPGHSDITGNEVADDLARQGALSDDQPTSVGVSPRYIQSCIATWAGRLHRQLWSEASVGQTTKELWGPPNASLTKRILRLNKISLRLLTAILTGHSFLRDHQCKLGLRDNPDCRGCGEEPETVTHFLCHCPALSARRLRFMGSYFLNELLEAGEVGWDKILRFTRATGWLDRDER